MARDDALADDDFYGFWYYSGVQRVLSFCKETYQRDREREVLALEIEGRALVKRIRVLNLCLGFLATALGFLVSRKAGFSVFAGWALLTINMDVLEWQLDRIFNRPKKPKSKIIVFAKCYLRYLVVVFVVWLLIHLKVVEPLAFSSGVFAFMLSFIGIAGEMVIKTVLRREG